MILEEYDKILLSLVRAQKEFEEGVQLDSSGSFLKITDAQYQSYFGHKRRKMNFQMLLLLDCIGHPSETIPEDLIFQIKSIGKL